jgi:hypothetical protein
VADYDFIQYYQFVLRRSAMYSAVRNITFIAFLTFFHVATSHASPVVTIPASQGSSFTVLGAGMDGVAGIQLDITYDSASLSSPSVSQGGLVTGAMLAANTNSPGIIKIAIISTRPFSGNGTIATISFASRNGTGGITSISASAIDNKGASLATSSSVQSTDTTQSASSSTTNQPSSNPQPQNTTAPTTTTSSTTPTYLGTVSMPTDFQRSDTASAKPASTPASGEQSATTLPTSEKVATPIKPSVEAKIDDTPQLVVYKSIAERFKQVTGNKTLPEMAALFDKKVAQSITQTPSLVLSDGKMSATVVIDLPARITSSPNFAVNNGKLVSFKQDKAVKGRWRAEVLPETNTTKVTLTIIAGSEEFEYPLTVAPVIKSALTLDAQGWKTFLKDSGTLQAPHHDLNGDGKRDYIDEYIFIANYLTVDKSAKTVSPTTVPAKKTKKK